MTELAGYITAEQVTAPYHALASAVQNAEVNDYPMRDPHFMRKDFDRVLEAATELLHVLGEQIRPRCEVVGRLGRCILPEHDDQVSHYDGICRWR